MPFFSTFLDKAMPVLAPVQGEDMLRQWCLALRERVDEEAGKTSTRAARSVRCAGVAQAVFDERPRATGAGLPGRGDTVRRTGPRPRLRLRRPGAHRARGRRTVGLSQPLAWGGVPPPSYNRRLPSSADPAPVLGRLLPA